MEHEKLLSSHKTYGTESQASSYQSAVDESEDRSSRGTVTSAYPMSDLISSKEHFTKEEIGRRVSQARCLSIFTLIMTIILTIMSFIVSQDSDSSAAYGFAFDSFLAGLTSTIILWRFWTVKELEHRNRKRELIALFIIVICLVVTGVLVSYRSIKALANKEKHKKSTTLLVMSAVSMLLYSILFILKYRLSKRLGSRALRTDSIDALCGAILSVSIVITTSTREFTTKTWFLDPTIAVGVAVFSIAYGVYSTAHLIKLYKEYREFLRGTRPAILPTETLYIPEV